jgi:hypothetical protein
MELPSSSSRGYLDSHRSSTNDLSTSWSSISRPTLNTSLSNHPIPSDLSPHLSPIPPHSPWPHSNNYLLPEMPNRNQVQGLSSAIPPFNSDWEHLFVPHPNHDSYHGFPPSASSPSGASHSLPGSYQNHYQPHLSNVSPASHPSSGSWSQFQSLTQHKPSRYPPKQSLPRSTSSSELKLAKGVSHFYPYRLGSIYLLLDDSRF